MFNIMGKFALDIILIAGAVICAGLGGQLLLLAEHASQKVGGYLLCAVAGVLFVCVFALIIRRVYKDNETTDPNILASRELAAHENRERERTYSFGVYSSISQVFNRETSTSMRQKARAQRVKNARTRKAQPPGKLDGDPPSGEGA